MLSKKWIVFARELAQESRSYKKFFHAMKTDSAISLYAYSMKRFMEFLHNEKYVDDPNDMMNY